MDTATRSVAGGVAGSCLDALVFLTAILELRRADER